MSGIMSLLRIGSLPSGKYKVGVLIKTIDGNEYIEMSDFIVEV